MPRESRRASRPAAISPLSVSSAALRATSRLRSVKRLARDGHVDAPRGAARPGRRTGCREDILREGLQPLTGAAKTSAPAGAGNRMALSGRLLPENAAGMNCPLAASAAPAASRSRPRDVCLLAAARSVVAGSRRCRRTRRIRLQERAGVRSQSRVRAAVVQVVDARLREIPGKRHRNQRRGYQCRKENAGAKVESDHCSRSMRCIRASTLPRSRPRPERSRDGGIEAHGIKRGYCGAGSAPPASTRCTISEACWPLRGVE